MADFTLDLKAHLNSADLQKQIKAISKTQKIIIEADGSKVIKETAKWQEANNKIIKSVQTIDAETGKVIKTLRTVNESAKKLDQSFVDIVRKVSKFLIATTIISGVTTAIYKGVDAIFEMDKQLTELAKVTDLNNKQLKDFSDEAYEAGVQLGRTGAELVEASSEFAKAGFETDAMELGKIAVLYQNVADAQIDAGTASSFIVSQIKAFNIETSDAIHIIDAVNEVDILAFPIRNFRVIKDNYIG